MPYTRFDYNSNKDSVTHPVGVSWMYNHDRWLSQYCQIQDATP